ncbi:hypothetical protein [Streptomyces sp. SAJ15]|uniref:hypothetical protein n=1 Tax=Streptomyces sp. SAJ15 TaxID=2011095 RepID=UPI0011872434|nr:hypothetical protein [Streptomyces sp. SAJ15]TVL92792.1 hypothetical protein CD790_06425 [Streptomyces sp. SAJ15]
MNTFAPTAPAAASGAPVVTLDLRSAGARFSDPAELHRAVRESLGGTPVTTAGRFLLLDTAEGLAGHQHVYEQVLSYGNGHALCLAIGAPHAGSTEDDLRAAASPTQWALDRPSTLRPPAVGVLWVLDPYAGTADPEEDPRTVEEVLHPLVELLAGASVFDAVLHAIGELPEGVAVPALRVLEHDLAAADRERAWRQALADLVGEEVPGPTASFAPAMDELPAALAPLVGPSVPKSVEEAVWRRAGGEAAIRLRAAEYALDEAEREYQRLRGAAGLFGRTGRDSDLAGCLEQVAADLVAYRDTVEDALRDGDRVGLPPEQRRRLHEHGIDLPRVPETSRERVGPALRGYAQELLAKRLPLRSAAARLGALSDLATPTSSAARLPGLADACPPGLPDRLIGAHPFTVRGARRGELAATCALTAAAGLWPGPGWALGPLTAVAAAGLTDRAFARRPRADSGGTSGALAQLAAGLLGAAVGAVAGKLLGAPAWLGLGGLLLALLILPVLAVRRWTAAVDAWWETAGVPEARTALHTVDDILTDAVVHDWLLADARLYCADGARAIATMIRRAAAAAAPARGPGTVPHGAGDHDGREKGGEYGPYDQPYAHPEGWDRGDGWTDEWHGGWDEWSGGPDPWGEAVGEPYPEAGTAGYAETPTAGDESGNPVDREPSGHEGRRYDNGYQADGFHDDGLRDDGLGGGVHDGGVHGGGFHDEGARDDGPPDNGFHDGGFRDNGPPDNGPRDSGEYGRYDTSYAAAGQTADGVGEPYPRERRAAPWLEREAGDGGPELTETLAADIAEGIAQLLAPYWGTIERDPGTAAGFPLDQRVRELLAAESARLARDGVAAPPPHARPERERPEPAVLLGIAPDRVVRTLETEEHGLAPLALCAAEHRRLLSRDRHASRRVRFAPEAVRRSSAVVADDIVWTPAGRYAGVLRLLPPRTGSIRTVRFRDGGHGSGNGYG